ncbi:serine/threonine-protein kinase mos-like isoform X2 [Paramacrobiotus metropolitanus]|uniref:serine/threonine-protein kinase mos-like isoform X2 n=1 Tax=Paramacrobiotus metropolitanus TaxID=2943436 RepID=UPI00244603FD|nr:serine/threonine-protein kinase mos-like isoform X2 [Paramacrobiotus metropolitanus]
MVNLMRNVRRSLSEWHFKGIPSEQLVEERLVILHRHGTAVYEHVAGAIVKELKQVSKTNLQNSGNVFLAALRDMWRLFKDFVSTFCQFCLTVLLDKIYSFGIVELVQIQGQVFVQNNLDNFHALGLRIFRDNVIYHHGIREKLRVVMLNSNRWVRTLDAYLLRKSYQILTELGGIEVYQTICGSPCLRHYGKLLSKVKQALMQNKRKEILHSSRTSPLAKKTPKRRAQSTPPRVNLFGHTCYYNYNNCDYRGAGTFGAVFEVGAVVGGTKRRVAVKVMPMQNESDLVNNTEKWNSWCQRLRTITALIHPHVVRYHGVIADCQSARIEIVMDYCVGDLSHYLHLAGRNETVIDIHTAMRYASEIADGLQFLHYNGIIHGDLKPGNILARHNGAQIEMILGDLDDSVQLRCFMSGTDDLSHIHGTIRYMAPEILKKFIAQIESEIPGRKSDMWSYGCVLLDLANCVTKLEKKWLCKASKIIEVGKEMTDMQFVILIAKKNFVPHVDGSIPCALKQRIRRCLCSSKHARISSEEMLQSLKEWRDRN